MRPARREMRLKTFTFSATQDDVDDGESVKLTFGTPLPARVSAGTVSESTVNIQSKTPLTASVESAPPSHNGSDEFRIRIAFSEKPKTGFSYKIMRDHAFTVMGGSVTGARRLEPLSNIGWEVVVEPDSNGDAVGTRILLGVRRLLTPRLLPLLPPLPPANHRRSTSYKDTR